MVEEGIKMGKAAAVVVVVELNQSRCDCSSVGWEEEVLYSILCGDGSSLVLEGVKR